MMANCGLALALVVSVAAVVESQEEWQIEVVSMEGTKPEVALDSEGRPRITYMIEDFGGGVFFAQKDEDEWAIEIVSEGYFYAPLDMVIDESGVPNIAYHDHDNEDIVWAVKPDGDSWSLEVISHQGHDGWEGRIQIGPQGEVHIVSVDPSQFGSTSGVEWSTRRDGQWTTEEIGSGPIPYEFGIDLAIDNDGRLHVVYHDGGSVTPPQGTGPICSMLSEMIPAGRFKRSTQTGMWESSPPWR